MLSWKTKISQDGSCACSMSPGRGPIRLSPRMSRLRLASSKTGRPVSAFGKPMDNPVTTMSPRCKPRSRTRCVRASAEVTHSAVGESADPVSSDLHDGGAPVGSAPVGRAVWSTRGADPSVLRWPGGRSTEAAVIKR